MSVQEGARGEDSLACFSLRAYCVPGTMLEEMGILGCQGERENGLRTGMQKKSNHDDDGNCC